MNVILTKSFLEKFKKDFRKYNFKINDLVKELKKVRPITLKEPYYKVKFKINTISIRGVVFLNLNNRILPVFIVLKKDKKYGENLTLNKETIFILDKLSNDISIDLNNGNFIEY